MISEYRITCPLCESKLIVVSEDANPIMVYCEGCSNVVVINDGMIYMVSFSFYKRMYEQYNFSKCGKVVQSLRSSKAEDMGLEKSLENLHNLLTQRMDVSEFIKKLD